MARMGLIHEQSCDEPKMRKITKIHNAEKVGENSDNYIKKQVGIFRPYAKDTCMQSFKKMSCPQKTIHLYTV